MTKVSEDEKTPNEELKKAKTRYEELFEKANVVIATTDPEGYIKKVSKKAEGVSGYSENELIGKNILKLSHPKDEEKFMEVWNRVLEGELEESVVRIKTKGGDTRWLKVGGSPIHRDGEVFEIQYTAQDITELKEAEERARREEKRFKELFKGSNDLVATTDLEGEIKKLNEKCWRFFGYTKEELIGRNIIELAHPDNRDSWFEIYDEVLENKESTRVLKGLDRDGNTVWLKTGGRAIMEDDEIVELQYNSQDITQIKESKERQDLLHSLLRHDVRNKAQVVQGYLEIVQTYDLPEDLEDHLSKARKGLSDALEIITLTIFRIAG